MNTFTELHLVTEAGGDRLLTSILLKGRPLVDMSFDMLQIAKVADEQTVIGRLTEACIPRPDYFDLAFRARVRGPFALSMLAPDEDARPRIPGWRP